MTKAKKEDQRNRRLVEDLRALTSLRIGNVVKAAGIQYSNFFNWMKKDLSSVSNEKQLDLFHEFGLIESFLRTDVLHSWSVDPDMGDLSRVMSAMPAGTRVIVRPVEVVPPTIAFFPAYIELHFAGKGMARLLIANRRSRAPESTRSTRADAEGWPNKMSTVTFAGIVAGKIAKALKVRFTQNAKLSKLPAAETLTPGVYLFSNFPVAIDRSQKAILWNQGGPRQDLLRQDAFDPASHGQVETLGGVTQVELLAALKDTTQRLENLLKTNAKKDAEAKKEAADAKGSTGTKKGAGKKATEPEPSGREFNNRDTGMLRRNKDLIRRAGA